MDLIEIISSIIATIEVDDLNDDGHTHEYLTFFYGKDSEKNLEGDSGVFPSAMLDMPIKWESELKQSGIFEDTYMVIMLFCNKAKMDATPIEHWEIIKAMKEYSREFLVKLQDHASVKRFELISGEGFEGLFDSNVSGVMLNVAVVLKYEDSNCF